jgi:hypothetical protein
MSVYLNMSKTLPLNFLETLLGWTFLFGMKFCMTYSILNCQIINIDVFTFVLSKHAAANMPVHDVNLKFKWCHLFFSNSKGFHF